MSGNDHHEQIVPRTKPKWEEGEFIVREVKGVEEVEKYHWQWAKNEQWNPRLNDAKLLYAADPKGFFVGEYNGEVVSCISCVLPESNNDKFGFVGYYIVSPDHRGRGFGFKTWMHSWSRASGHVLGLDGVVQQLEHYSSLGFKLSWTNIRYRCEEQLKPPPTYEVSDIEIRVNGFDAKLASEYESFQPRSEGWMQRWATDETAQNVMAVSKSTGKCVGFSVVHKAVTGYRLGPLYADTPSLSKHLVVKLISLLGETVSVESPVFMDVPLCNTSSKELVDSLGFKEGFETGRMWKGEAPKLPINDKIFVVCTLEIG